MHTKFWFVKITHNIHNYLQTNRQNRNLTLFNTQKLTMFVSVTSDKKLRTMVVAKKYVLAKQFEHWPKESDLQVVQEELPPLKDGG